MQLVFPPAVAVRRHAPSNPMKTGSAAGDAWDDVLMVGEGSHVSRHRQSEDEAGATAVTVSGIHLSALKACVL